MDTSCNLPVFKAKGYKKEKTYTQYEDGQLVSYHYFITYDRFGTEIDRTKPEVLGKENNHL